MVIANAITAEMTDGKFASAFLRVLFQVRVVKALRETADGTEIPFARQGYRINETC